MHRERLLGEVLAERHWTPIMLALAADIDKRTAERIIAGQSRVRGTTAIRVAEALGIGYGPMRRILAATWEAGHADQTDAGSGPLADPARPVLAASPAGAVSPVPTPGGA